MTLTWTPKSSTTQELSATQMMTSLTALLTVIVMMLSLIYSDLSPSEPPGSWPEQRLPITEPTRSCPWRPGNTPQTSSSLQPSWQRLNPTSNSRTSTTSRTFMGPSKVWPRTSWSTSQPRVTRRMMTPAVTFGSNPLLPQDPGSSSSHTP